LRETIKSLNDAKEKRLMKTSAVRTKIRPDFVGHTLDVFNGEKYVRVQVTEEMIGRRLVDVASRNTPTARLKYVSIPPRKMRLVADLVRGMPVERALDVLHFTNRIAARHLAKTIKSAAANVLSLEGTDSVTPEDLRVKDIQVDSAPTAKRIRFQSMGRVFRIRKRYCHVSVWLESPEPAPTEEAKPKARKKAGEKSAEPRKSGGRKKAGVKKAGTKKTAAKKKSTGAEKKADDAAEAKPKKKAPAKKASAKPAARKAENKGKKAAKPDTKATADKSAKSKSAKASGDDSAKPAAKKVDKSKDAKEDNDK
jgi:large subunit ribosomal protein L22